MEGFADKESRPSTPFMDFDEINQFAEPIAYEEWDDGEVMNLDEDFMESDSEYHSIDNDQQLHFVDEDARFSYICEQLILQLHSDALRDSPKWSSRADTTMGDRLDENCTENEEIKNSSRIIEIEDSDDEVDEGNLNRKPANLKFDKNLSCTEGSMICEENYKANKIELGNYRSRNMNQLHTNKTTTIITDIVTATTTTAIDVNNHAGAFTNSYHVYCSNTDGGLNKLKNQYEKDNYDEVVEQNLLNQEYMHMKLKYKIILLENMLLEMKEELRLRRKIIDRSEKEMNKKKCDFFIKLNNEPNLNGAHHLSIRYNEYLGNKTRQLIKQKNLYAKLKIQYETLYNIYKDVVNGKHSIKNILMLNTSISEQLPSTNISLSQVSSSCSSSEVQSSMSSSLRSSSTTSLTSSSINMQFSDISMQIEEKEREITCIRKQLSQKQENLHYAQFSQNTLKEKLLSAKCDKKALPVNNAKENFDDNFSYCTEKIEEIRNNILLLKSRLHNVTKEKANLTKRLNTENKNVMPTRITKHENKTATEKFGHKYGNIYSEDNHSHQQFQLFQCESVYNQMDENHKFKTYTNDGTIFSGEARNYNVFYNNVTNNAMNKVNNDADKGNQNNYNARLIGIENNSNTIYIDNYNDGKFDNKRTVQQILFNLVALMMPDTPDFKKLKAENVALKRKLNEVVEKMKIIDCAKDKIALIQDYILRNKDQLDILGTKLNFRQKQYPLLLNFDELNDQVGLLYKQLKSLSNITSTCGLDFEEFEVKLFEDKITVIENDNSQSNGEDNTNGKHIPLEDDIAKEKRLQQINVLMKELEDLIVIEFKTSSDHILPSQYKDKTGKVNDDNKLDKSKCIDLDEVLHALEMAELKAVNLNHQLALKEMELRHLTEVFNEQNNELGILENITMLSNQCAHKNCNDIGLQNGCSNEDSEIECLRELLRKEKETTFILKSIHDRLYDIIAIEYEKKISYYHNKVDELRTKGNMSNDEVQAHFLTCLKGIYSERGTKFTKINLQYIHIDDIIDVFNRTMRIKPDLLSIIEEAGLFIGSQLKRWQQHLKNTGDILAKRYS